MIAASVALNMARLLLCDAAICALAAGAGEILAQEDGSGNIMVTGGDLDGSRLGAGGEGRRGAGGAGEAAGTVEAGSDAMAACAGWACGRGGQGDQGACGGVETRSVWRCGASRTA